jgi:hypothetical protein
MLATMNDAWIAWLFVVGIAIGAAVTFVLLVRLPRDEEDVSAFERPAEANWIAGTIERNGGVAPKSLVEEVLDLHAAYLRVQRPQAPAGGMPPAPPPAYAPTPPPPPPQGAAPPPPPQGAAPPGIPPAGSPPPGAHPRSRVR